MLKFKQNNVEKHKEFCCIEWNEKVSTAYHWLFDCNARINIHIIGGSVMMEAKELVKQIQEGQFDARLKELYAFREIEKELAHAKARAIHTIDGFCTAFADREPADCALYSGPGRTEIGGNHTDHQHGRVLCGSVALDMLACASPREDGVIRIVSEGYPQLILNVADTEKKQDEINTSNALVRGVVAGITEKGYTVGGFDAYITSIVPAGSGLSSSAAYEILVGNILNDLYCNGQLTALELAQIGQYAENVYFGKPCGLMDQAACAFGGVVAIDFQDPKNPCVEKIEYDLARSGYVLCIVDTGSCHADLTDDYAGITQEMGQVANWFGKKVLREVNQKEFEAAIPKLRQQFGDRAVLRSMHFFAENDRAAAQAEALKAGDMQGFLQLVRESGRSSAVLLQNTWSVADPAQQAIPLTLAVAEQVLQGEGAARVHGGGFAGTIQAFVPQTKLDAFVQRMEALLGVGKCHIVSIRPEGGCVVINP